MQLLKAPLICGVLLLLTACGDSNNTPLSAVDEATTNDPVIDTANEADANVDADNTPEPANGEAGIGSITISTEQAIQLEPLPDVTHTPTSNTTDSGSDSSDSDSGVVDAVPSPESSVSSGLVGGSTGGDSDTSGATAGSSTDGAGTTTGATGVSTDASMVGTGDATRPTSPPVEVDELTGSQPDFQAGSLTAADYEDQLNPHLYQDYASEYLQRVGGRLDVPYLDLSRRIGLHVTDEQGRPYGFARIDISDANGQLLSLQVPSSGVTYIYRDLDKLPEQFTLYASGLLGEAISKDFDLAQLDSGRINIVMPNISNSPLAGDAHTSRLDIMFVIDTTGSMGDELNYLQTELSSIINALPNDILPSVGLTFYRDIGDDYVVRAHGFNIDIAGVQRTLNDETFDGGGDYPEAMDQALHQAIDANWREDSHRVLFLIADAPPHGDKMRATWEAAEKARTQNIRIVPVAASGVGDDAEYLMRSMAAFTNGRYAFLTDDSGFGNSHAEPDVDCYVVTQLNNLMIRIVNSLMSGVRQEPADNEIIRTVGNYNNGVCEPL